MTTSKSCPSSTAPTRRIAALADGKSIRYINIHEQLAFPGRTLREGMANDGLHLTPKAYQVWADALKPLFTEILGPPAASTARRRPRATRASHAKSVTIAALTEQDKPREKSRRSRVFTPVHAIAYRETASVVGRRAWERFYRAFYPHREVITTLGISAALHLAVLLIIGSAIYD